MAKKQEPTYFGEEFPEFNAQGAWLKKTMERWDELDKSSIMADYTLWYRCLQNFYVNVKPRIKQKLLEELQYDKEKFNEWEKHIEDTMDSIKRLLGKSQGEDFADPTMIENNDDRIEELIFEAKRQIYDKLFQIGLIFPLTKDYDWIEEMRRTFS